MQICKNDSGSPHCGTVKYMGGVVTREIIDILVIVVDAVIAKVVAMIVSDSMYCYRC
jgi:hypothetical protein